MLTLGVILAFANRLGDFVRPPIQVFHLFQTIATLGIQSDQAIDVRRHASITTVLLDGLDIVDDEIAIQHGFVL